MMGNEVKFVKPDGEVVLLSASTSYIYTDIYPVLDGVTVRLWKSYDTNWLGIKRYDVKMNLISDSKWNSKTTISPSECVYFQLYGCQSHEEAYKIYALWS